MRAWLGAFAGICLAHCLAACGLTLGGALLASGGRIGAVPAAIPAAYGALFPLAAALALAAGTGGPAGLRKAAFRLRLLTLLPFLAAMAAGFLLRRIAPAFRASPLPELLGGLSASEGAAGVGVAAGPAGAFLAALAERLSRLDAAGSPAGLAGQAGMALFVYGAAFPAWASGWRLGAAAWALVATALALLADLALASPVLGLVLDPLAALLGAGGPDGRILALALAEGLTGILLALLGLALDAERRTR